MKENCDIIIVSIYDSYFRFSLAIDNIAYHRSDIENERTPTKIVKILKTIEYSYYNEIINIIENNYSFKMFYIIEDGCVINIVDNRYKKDV